MKASKNGLSIRSWLFDAIKYKKLDEYIDEIESVGASDDRSLDELISQVCDKDFMSEKDRNRASEFTADQVFEHFNDRNQDSVTTILRKLRKLGWPEINQIAVRLANQSDINKMRMESMGFNLEQEDRGD